jgi:D-cysteine desulfhydrase
MAMTAGPRTLAGLAGASASPAAELAGRVLALAAECLALLAAGAAVTSADVEVTDVRGPGHGLPSAEGGAMAAKAMGTGGLMTDPVYPAKALSLVARQPAPGAVVFRHTGGMLGVVAAAKEAAR